MSIRKTKVIHVTGVPDDVHEKMRQLAHEADATINDYMVHVIEEWVAMFGPIGG